MVDLGELPVPHRVPGQRVQLIREQVAPPALQRGQRPEALDVRPHRAAVAPVSHLTVGRECRPYTGDPLPGHIRVLQDGPGFLPVRDPKQDCEREPQAFLGVAFTGQVIKQPGVRVPEHPADGFLQRVRPAGPFVSVFAPGRRQPGNDPERVLIGAVGGQRLHGDSPAGFHPFPGMLPRPAQDGG